MAPFGLNRRRLHGSGHKATPQRLFILQAIGEFESQFTSQELYRHLRKRHPSIGLVTIYRTLKVLADEGFICRMGISGKSLCYAHRPEQQHHHHLVCTGCNKVLDIVNCSLAELERKLASDTGFDISEHHLEFIGLCQACQKSNGGSAV